MYSAQTKKILKLKAKVRKKDSKPVWFERTAKEGGMGPKAKRVPRGCMVANSLPELDNKNGHVWSQTG